MANTPQLIGACVAGAAAATVAGWLLSKKPPQSNGGRVRGGGGGHGALPFSEKSLLLEGSVMVITGGSSGIGREIALQAAAAGCKVVVMDLTTEPLEGGPSTVDAWAAKESDGVGEGGGGKSQKSSSPKKTHLPVTLVIGRCHALEFQTCTVLLSRCSIFASLLIS